MKGNAVSFHFARMILRFSAVVVQQEPFPIELREDDDRQHRQQVRVVRSRVGVYDVVPPEPGHRHDPIHDRVDHSADVLDPLEEPERPRQARRVRNEADLDGRLRGQSVHEAFRLS